MNEKDEEDEEVFAKVAEALLQVVSRECAVLAGELILSTPDLVFSQPQYKAGAVLRSIGCDRSVRHGDQGGSHIGWVKEEEFGQ